MKATWPPWSSLMNALLTFPWDLIQSPLKSLWVFALASGGLDQHPDASSCREQCACTCMCALVEGKLLISLTCHCYIRTEGWKPFVSGLVSLQTMALGGGVGRGVADLKAKQQLRTCSTPSHPGIAWMEKNLQEGYPCQRSFHPPLFLRIWLQEVMGPEVIY